jgi:pimeloyl-ACP methyl ester carboxylesterase
MTSSRQSDQSNQFNTPAVLPRPTRFAAVPDLAPRELELASGLRMPYIACGEGPLVLFVHGSLCDYRYWQPQLDGLSSRYRCVSVSLTHYWPRTDLPLDVPFSWRCHVDELADFLARLGEGPAHVVGHSRGASVAFHFACSHARYVRTLTLADPGGPVQMAGQASALLPDTVNALRARVAQLIDAGESGAALQLFIDSVSRPGSWAQSTAAFRTMAADNVETFPRQFHDSLPAYTANDANQVRCPVLLIDGEKSPAMFKRTVAALETWLSDARRRTVRGASHGMNLAHPSAFNRFVDEFICGVA